MKPKGFTTQIKALDEYFIMVATIVHIVSEQTSYFCNFYV